MLELLYSLGLRIGEIVALNVEDYSRFDNSVLIRGKGERESVLYISSEEVREKLARWLEERKECSRRVRRFLLTDREDESAFTE